MIEYRTASIQDLYLMLDWAAEEGWNPGSDDAAAFHAADPKGFFLAMDDSAPVAAISVVNHSDTFAFLGLYIALPSHRRKGIATLRIIRCNPKVVFKSALSLVLSRLEHHRSRESIIYSSFF